MKLFLREVVPERNPIPGAVIAIQTFGDFQIGDVVSEWK